MLPLRERGVIGGVTLFIVCLAWYFARHYYNDDAFISLRYAANWLNGNGLTWNPGERVEGYTNFLFVALVALLGSVGIDLVLATRLIGFICFALLVLVMARYMQRLRFRDSDNIRLICLSLVIASVPLLIWCLGGLEGTLFTLLSTTGLCKILKIWRGEARRKVALVAGVLFGLATLTRPEGVLFMGYASLTLLLRHRKQLMKSPLLPLLVGYAILVIPHLIWRQYYYGEWLPNTYYAKGFGISASLLLGNGFAYLFEYACMPPLLLFFSIGLGLYAWYLKRDKTIAYLLPLIGLLCAYVVRVGGDGLLYYRFMLPIIPVMVLVIYHSMVVLADQRRHHFLRDIKRALLFFLLLQLPLVGERGYTLGALSGLSVADYAKATWREGALVATNSAGALPYVAPQFRYIDMLGLNDHTIARRVVDRANSSLQGRTGHMKGNGAYVLSRQPDYIIFGLGWSGEPAYVSDTEIHALPEFTAQYRKVEAWVTPPANLLSQLESAARLKGEAAHFNRENLLRFIYYERTN